MPGELCSDLGPTDPLTAPGSTSCPAQTHLLLQTVFMVGLDVPCQGFAPPASGGLRVGHLASGLSRTRSTAAAKSERHLLVPPPEGMDPCLLLFLLLMEHRLGHDSGVQGALSSLG